MITTSAGCGGLGTGLHFLWKKMGLGFGSLSPYWRLFPASSGGRSLPTWVFGQLTLMGFPVNGLSMLLALPLLRMLWLFIVELGLEMGCQAFGPLIGWELVGC